jgi:hypothetical protein
MKSRALLCALLFFSAGRAAAEAIVVPALGPRFKQTRERTDALFGLRTGTLPPSDSQTNLFRASAELTPPRQTTQIDVSRSNQPSDETILQEALAALKKGGGGLVALGGRYHLTFNQKVYKDGDVILVPVRGRSVEIRIIRVSVGSVTLALNDNEVVWWF